MYPNKLLSLIIIGLLIIGCGPDVDQIKSELAINFNAENGTITNNQTLNLSIDNMQNHKLEAVGYFLDGIEINSQIDLNNQKLGKRTIEAEITFEGTKFKISKDFTILNSTAPTVYSFNIINEYPHDITAYTQGLEFHNGELFESTGQYGESQLRKIDFKTGKVLQSYDLENNFFGEGLTVLNDKIYQLTWQESTGFVYDINTFERMDSFKYGNSKEGWGICNNGNTLFKSDGTEKIWLLDPETLVEQSYIEAYHYKGKTVGLNELEWIDGRIYANRYQLNGVAIINPHNGAIEGVVDFSSLKNKVAQHPELDVLNGIAYNPETNTIFVTGKYWNKLFEVEIIAK